MAKIMKKAQTGKNVPKGMVESEMSPGKMIPKSKSNYENGKYAKMLGSKPKAKVAPKKAQSGIEAALEAKTAERNTKGPALREGQVKRMTRVFNANPERGIKVGKRMIKRAVNSSSVMKAGGMLKRADGSYSKRGLWDNLRSKAAQNKKAGAKPKAPTKAMLSQEKKIKAKGK
jgi:hypothetical protein